MIVTTKLSKYRIDPEAKTFQKLPNGRKQTYQYLRLEVGTPLEILYPVVGKDSGYLEISDVVGVEEE